MNFSALRHIPVQIIALITVISFIGIAMLYSAANGHMEPWAIKQFARFCLGFVLMIMIAITDMRSWMSSAYIIYGVSLFLLVLVEVMGVVGMGAQRWINLYVFNFQPSEVMRVAIVLALARYFSSAELVDVHRPAYLIKPLLMIVAPTLLVMRQPDLGTAMMLLASGISVFFVVGVRIWKFMAAGGLAAAAIPILWNFLHDYQKNRVLIFLDPERDPANTGYHVTQSKIALGSGGFWGKGFLKGTQSHLNFLPEKQTDFIFTMYSEEFGMLGGVILLILYAIWLSYGLETAIRTKNKFGQLVIIGLNTTFFVYVFVNIAMVMGMLPVVGIPLPFFSYGGTALITLMISQGLIFSVSAHQQARFGR
jgi:rod shape determining protein RodA